MAQYDPSFLEFLIPDIGRYKQAKALSQTSKELSNRILGDRDVYGNPVEGPQRPGYIQPTPYNQDALSAITPMLESGNRGMQMKGLEGALGLITDQSTRAATADAFQQGKDLQNQLDLLIQNRTDITPQLTAQKRLYTEFQQTPAKPTPGLVGQYEAATKAGYIPEGTDYMGFVKMLEKAQATGREQAGGDDTSKMKHYREMVKLGYPDHVAKGLAYGAYKQQTLGDKDLLLDLSQDPPRIVGEFVKEGGYRGNIKFKPAEKPLDSSKLPWNVDIANTPKKDVGKVKDVLNWDDLPE